MNKFLFTITLSLMTLLSAVAQGKKAEKKESYSAISSEVEITSSKMEMDYEKQRAVFTENVEVVDSRIEIYSDQLTVFFDEKQEVQSLEAIAIGGQVTIIMHSEGKPDTIAKGSKVTYDAKTQLITLLEQCSIETPDRSIRGAEKISFVIDEKNIKKFDATGGRVTLKSKKKASNEKGVK